MTNQIQGIAKKGSKKVLTKKVLTKSSKGEKKGMVLAKSSHSYWILKVILKVYITTKTSSWLLSGKRSTPCEMDVGHLWVTGKLLILTSMGLVKSTLLY